MSIPVETPKRRWESRIVAESDCLQILRQGGYAIGARITAADDVEVLTELAAIHPHAAEKIGPGIDFFTIEHVAGLPGQNVSSDALGFVLHQIGGHRVDFSYLEAIYPSDQKRRVTTALRAEVEDLRYTYRDLRFASGSAVSDFSDTPFKSRAEASVIYNEPSFSQLAYRFAETEGGWNAIDVDSGGASPFVGDALADEPVRLRWREFFKLHSRPQLATKSEGARRPRVDEAGWTP